MKRELSPTIAIVVLLFGGSNLQQVVVGQAVREPTIDERFRDPKEKSVQAEVPKLNALQTQAPTPTQRENPATINPAVPAYLGVTFGTNSRSAIVRTVSPGSPADQAGLQPNDTIETLQGRAVRSYQDVLDIVAKMRPGDMLDVGFSRKVNVRTQAALGNMPTATPRSVGYPPESSAGAVQAAQNSEHELLPVPAGSKMSTPSANSQPKKSTSSQNRNTTSSGQRNYNSQNNQNNAQSDGDRRFFGRGRRR